jgi:hypothetical protein
MEGIEIPEYVRFGNGFRGRYDRVMRDSPHGINRTAVAGKS